MRISRGIESRREEVRHGAISSHFARPGVQIRRPSFERTTLSDSKTYVFFLFLWRWFQIKFDLTRVLNHMDNQGRSPSPLSENVQKLDSMEIPSSG